MIFIGRAQMILSRSIINQQANQWLKNNIYTKKMFSFFFRTLRLSLYGIKLGNILYDLKFGVIFYAEKKYHKLFNNLSANSINDYLMIPMRNIIRQQAILHWSALL